jgi:hypothetical protein
MATAFKFVRNLDGSNNPPAIAKLPVATTQTLEIGDPVELSSGQLIIGTDGFGICAGVMAQDSTSAAAGTLVEVYVTSPSQVWRAVASADATSHVLVARTYDLNSSQVVNVADTTGGCIQILELVPGGATTDVHVQFTANALA